MFRQNSTLHQIFDGAGLELIQHGANAIARILPHVEISTWTQNNWERSASVWGDGRTRIRFTLALGPEENPHRRSLTAVIKRRNIAGFAGAAGRVLDTREHEICRLISARISEVAANAPKGTSPASLSAIREAFDEGIVARYVEEHHGLRLSVSSVLEALHTLSEQSYENKAITFGCLLDTNLVGVANNNVLFPGEFLLSKKYKALSDGYRTAYHISTYGKVVDFVDLEQYKPLTGTHYFPDWAEGLARASRLGRCGIALSRQGDILVFDEGTLRFTYRYGQWQYWGHTHLVRLLSDAARSQRVPSAIRGNVVGAVYRAALDVSFRRSGGLFVILRRRGNLREVVRDGDAIGDFGREPRDREFDAALRGRKIQALPRRVVAELASLDGAIVLANSGQILAYGAVLQPRRAGRIRGTEGSRTKAAIGASNYGLAVKISSDGDLTVYQGGREFLRI